ncbi:venom protease [Megalopta genalis]|uniref:venom protease n=1 Tax=Megalopta genalis TaxID=115081 RepID=UPI003FD0C0E9
MTFPSSFLPVVLSSLLFTLLLAVSSIQGQGYEDDDCTVDSGPGKCKRLEQCPSVYDELLKGNPPVAVCGFIGFQQLVCCPSTVQPTTTTTTTEATAVTGGSEPLSAKSISRSKCEEYSRAVYQLVIPPLLSVDSQAVNVSVCAIKSRKLIVGGKKADPKEFPHMAAIGFDGPEGVIFSCGGSLISERYVLSAAHCFYSVEWGPPTWVRVGDMNLERTDDKAKPQQVKIIERLRHPDYKRPAMYHDIGLLKLKSPVTFDAWVRPLCLPYFVPDTANEKVATAVGWGKVDWGDENGSNDLLKVTINLVDNDRCNRSVRDDRVVPRGVIDNWQICAGEPGKDTCQGDSGGPLVILNPDYNCMYSILGVTSFGGLCGSAIPGVYARVSHYVPWIEKTIWPESV